jgi:diadenosine tetraphosphatase ApaH/serine/threonine PP2A family protein phosphatase
MRFAIVADIHSNLAALTAVLDDVELRGGVDEVWSLGDVVGYGPDPHQCLELLRRYNHVGVAGNHDWAAIGKVDTSDFNPDAAAACHWTAHQLSPEDIGYLESLPLVVQRDDFTLVHGSPRDPIWEYLLAIGSARQNFAYFQSQFCLAGHSHVPLVFELEETGECIFIEFPAEGVLALAEKRLIINPGGVGQPRDGDPRASYAIFDNEAMSITHYRIPYDISATQTRMVANGLPRRLTERLSYGL